MTQQSQFEPENTHHRTGQIHQLTWLSFFLSLIIVYRHAVNYTIYDTPFLFTLFQKWVFQISTVAVPMFFAISGALFQRGLTKDTRKNKLKKRFKSIFVPMVIWNTAGYLLLLICSSVPAIAAQLGETASLTIPALLKSALIGTSMNGPLWYLKALCGFFLLLLVLQPLVTNRKAGWICALIPLIIEFFVNIGEYPYISSFSYFACGAWFMEFTNGELLQREFGKRTSHICICLFFVLTLLRMLSEALWNMEPGYFADKCFLYLLMGTLWIGFQSFPLQAPKQWWIKISFFIYCIHSLILEPMEKVCQMLIGTGTLGGVIDFFVVPLVTLLLIFGIAAFLKRYLKKIWEIVSGGRG